MATTYTLSKYKDVYTLKNIDTLPFRFALYLVECLTSNIVKDIILQPGKEIDLFTGLMDGQYELIVYSDNSLTTINYYHNLNLDIINNIEKIVCGCKDCNDCEDCADCNLYLSTITTILAYYFIDSSLYNKNLDNVAISMNCNTSEKIFCYLAKQMVTGDSDTKRLFLQIVGMYYLSFYYTDLDLSIDTEESSYINNKYKSTKILKCLKNMGMIIAPPIASVYYWQLSNMVDDIADIIPIFTLSYLNNRPNELLSVFEQGKVVNYNNIARIAFAIRKVQISDFVVTDVLNNDITDEFDKYYFSSTETWLFVSKLVYSNSNMYFKFKQLP